MTLQDLGNIGEFVGAIGVIVSLVYLATQIRQNTKAVRSNTSQAITDSRVEFLSSISDNPEVARMFFSGLSDLDSLGPDERSRFAIMMARFIATMENYHYQHLVSLRQACAVVDSWLASGVKGLAPEARWVEGRQL